MRQPVDTRNHGTGSKRRTLTRVLGILFLAAVAAGSAAVVASSRNHAGIALLAHAEGDKGRSEISIVRGVLRFDAARGCVYLEQQTDGRRVLPQWPEGYHA